MRRCRQRCDARAVVSILAKSKLCAVVVLGQRLHHRGLRHGQVCGVETDKAKVVTHCAEASQCLRRPLRVSRSPCDGVYMAKNLNYSSFYRLYWMLIQYGYVLICVCLIRDADTVLVCAYLRMLNKVYGWILQSLFG
jgi:hypothetical protein